MKLHTLKSQLAIRGGKAVCIFGSKGRKHDFRVYKESKVSFGRGITKVDADSGYQDLHKRCKAAVVPVKGSKRKPLDAVAKAHNQALASERISIEHYIRRLKVFRILKHTYRNRRRKYFLRLNLIAAVCNLQLPP